VKGILNSSAQYFRLVTAIILNFGCILLWQTGDRSGSVIMTSQ